MKLYFLISGLCIFSWLAKGQTTCGYHLCPIVQETSINDCEAGLDKYLARGILMRGLVSTVASVSWPDSCNDSAYACSNPYSTCPSGYYCPARYCEDINLAVALKAGFLIDVASIWGDEWKIQPGSSWYSAASQCVKDINQAYDCARLPRPIIGASIFEWVSDAINGRKIPADVIAQFTDESDFNQADFPTDVVYNIEQIEIDNQPGTPDISKLQTRMWLYQCAKTYIDMGYTNIQLDMIGWSLIQGKDPLREKSYNLVRKIRAYALSKGTFVLLSSTVKDELFFYNGIMLFDFRLGPLRPMETKNAIAQPCIGELNALLNNKVGEAYQSILGGMSPTGCQYSRIPFVVTFDHHAGICGKPGVADDLDYCIYGYDESRWFNALSENCQQSWLEYALKDVKQQASRGYIALPGRLILNPWPPSRYRLSDNQTVLNAIKSELWRVDTSGGWTTNFTTTEMIGSCVSGAKYRTKYTFLSTDSSLTNVTTWEIVRPDGASELVKFGRIITYEPAEDGWYTIVMKRFNLGYYPQHDLKRQVAKRVYLTRAFCRNLVKMFPNPSAHEVQFQANYPISGIFITAATGVTILQMSEIGTNNVQVDVSNISQGVYWVKVLYDDGNFEIKKLTITH